MHTRPPNSLDPRPLSKLALVTICAFSFLLGLGAHLWLKAHDLQEQLKQRALAAPARTWERSVTAPAPVAPAALPALSFRRPWLRSGTNSFFAFTDEEWKALAAAFPEKLFKDGPEQALLFSEGMVIRAAESELEALQANGATVQTNEVWFLK
jgi:hypothetical protein